MRIFLALVVSLFLLSVTHGQVTTNKFYVMTSVKFPVDGEQREILFWVEHDTIESARAKHQGENIRFAVYGRAVELDRPVDHPAGTRFWFVWIGKPDTRNDEMFYREFATHAAMSEFAKTESAKEGYQFRAAVAGSEIVLRRP